MTRKEWEQNRRENNILKTASNGPWLSLKDVYLSAKAMPELQVKTIEERFLDKMAERMR